MWNVAYRFKCVVQSMLATGWRNAETAEQPVAMRKMGQRGSFTTLLYLGDRILSYLFVSSSSVSQWCYSPEIQRWTWPTCLERFWRHSRGTVHLLEPYVQSALRTHKLTDGQTPRPSTNCISYHVIDDHVISPRDNRSAGLMTSIAAIFYATRCMRSAWFVSISGTTRDCFRAIIFAVGPACPT